MRICFKGGDIGGDVGGGVLHFYRVNRIEDPAEHLGIHGDLGSDLGGREGQEGAPASVSRMPLMSASLSNAANWDATFAAVSAT